MLYWKKGDLFKLGDTLWSPALKNMRAPEDCHAVTVLLRHAVRRRPRTARHAYKQVGNGNKGWAVNQSSKPFRGPVDPADNVVMDNSDGPYEWSPAYGKGT